MSSRILATTAIIAVVLLAFSAGLLTYALLAPQKDPTVQPVTIVTHRPTPCPGPYGPPIGGCR